MYFYKNLEKRKRRTKNGIKFKFVHIKALYRSRGGGAGGRRRVPEGDVISRRALKWENFDKRPN